MAAQSTCVAAHVDPKIRAEVKRWREELTRHNHRYYVLDDPLITDTEYDQLFRRLVALETQHPELHDPSSPTQKVGAPPLTAFSQVQHTLPMLSLANIVSREEMQEFHERSQRFLETDDPIEYMTEPKIDGVAVELPLVSGFNLIGIPVRLTAETTTRDLAEQILGVPGATDEEIAAGPVISVVSWSPGQFFDAWAAASPLANILDIEPHPAYFIRVKEGVTLTP